MEYWAMYILYIMSNVFLLFVFFLLDEFVDAETIVWSEFDVRF